MIYGPAGTRTIGEPSRGCCIVSECMAPSDLETIVLSFHNRKFSRPGEYVSANRSEEMVDLLEAVRHHCGDRATTLLDRHFRLLPRIYFERYSTGIIPWHLRLLAGLEVELPI